MCLLLALTGCDLLPSSSGSNAEVTIITQPEGAQIRLNGVSQGASPVTISGLKAGAHLLEAQRAGYRTALITVNLFDGQRVAHEIVMEPLRGLLLIESEPVGAEVVIDDAFRGRTPLMLSDLRLGRHRIVLHAENYFQRELSIDLEDRTPRHLFTELVSDSAALWVRSNPSGGEVRINGVPQGNTPTRIDRVRTGEVLVEIALDGFLPYQTELRLRSGEEHRLDAQLIPLPSGLTVVTSPPEARVYINNELRGDSPLTLTNLAVGTYRLRVERRGYADQERTIELPSGARRVEEFRLERNSGTIVLVTEPAGAQVHLDGELQGTTEAGESDVLSDPFTIDYVPAGERQLQLTRQGYQHAPRRITIEANQTLSLHETLTRLFIPNTMVRTGDRASDVFTGVLIRRHPNGDIDLETRPGIIATIPREDIRSVQPIRSED